jgi:multidrug efflux pump subunit AcrB
VEAVAANKSVGGAFTDFSVNVPQYFFDVDREKVRAQGVAFSDVFSTLQICLAESTSTTSTSSDATTG